MRTRKGGFEGKDVRRVKFGATGCTFLDVSGFGSHHAKPSL
jgi:hypothetical protein